MKRTAHLFAGDLHQPKPRHIHQDRFDRVTGKLFPERPHQRLLIFFRFHIDKIHNNNTGKIPQRKLARHLMRRLQINLKNGLRRCLLAGVFPRIDIDNCQTLP